MYNNNNSPSGPNRSSDKMNSHSGPRSQASPTDPNVDRPYDLLIDKMNSHSGPRFQASPTDRTMQWSHGDYDLFIDKKNSHSGPRSQVSPTGRTMQWSHGDYDLFIDKKNSHSGPRSQVSPAGPNVDRPYDNVGALSWAVVRRTSNPDSSTYEICHERIQEAATENAGALSWAVVRRTSNPDSSTYEICHERIQEADTENAVKLRDLTAKLNSVINANITMRSKLKQIDELWEQITQLTSVTVPKDQYELQAHDGYYQPVRPVRPIFYSPSKERGSVRNSQSPVTLPSGPLQRPVRQAPTLPSLLRLKDILKSRC